MAKFRKKPVVIEAVQWTGRNLADMTEHMGNGRLSLNQGRIVIETLEGTMLADIGDWIIRGVKGELYPCKPDIFEATYEPAEEGRK